MERICEQFQLSMQNLVLNASNVIVPRATSTNVLSGVKVAYDLSRIRRKGAGVMEGCCKLWLGVGSSTNHLFRYMFLASVPLDQTKNNST
jgi:hypothetical protein